MVTTRRKSTEMTTRWMWANQGRRLMRSSRDGQHALRQQPVLLQREANSTPWLGGL